VRVGRGFRWTGVYLNSSCSWCLCTFDHDSGGGLSVTVHRGFSMSIDQVGTPLFVLGYGKGVSCHRITTKFAAFLP
jgi:hypothetical protein